MEKYEKILKYQFDSYCKKVIKHAAYRLLRDNKKRTDNEVSMDLLLDFNRDISIFDFEGEFLLDELLKLDKRSIEILIAYYVYGMKCAEIAKILKTSSQNVSYLKNKAIDRLKIRLMDKEV